MNANADRAQMARTSLTIQENDLCDRRGARRAMRCYEIRDIEELGCGAAARNLMRSRDQIIGRKGESRSVEHLANVTSRLGSLGVMMQKRDARHDIQKHHAAKNRERLARKRLRE